MFFARLAILGATLIASVSAQARGVYNRPADATGNPDWWAPNHRSPCPALNTLANHGYINRNGKGVTHDSLRTAMKNVFHLDDDFSNFILNGLPNPMSLADMSKHNLIEHDASLVHADMFYKLNPAQVDGGLANDFLSRTDKDGFIGINEIAQTLRIRLIWCQQKQPGCDFKSNQRDITFREAAQVLQTFGGTRNGLRISARDAYSFLVEERIPDGWKTSHKRITLGDLNSLSLAIQKAAGMAS